MAEEATKIGELFEEFAGGFLRPLLKGGEAQAVRALPPGLVETFALTRPVDTEVEHDLQRETLRAASEIAPVAALATPDIGAMATAMAIHNLGGLTDPLLDRAFARGSRQTVIAWTKALIELIPPPRTRSEALHRHVLLDRGLGFQRVDTVVKNWAYTYRFYGRPPPANVVAMPRLRFVRQEHKRRGLLDLVSDKELDLELQPLLDALLARSPVTQLLRFELTPRLTFGTATLAVLSDAGLRHGVVQAIVKKGTGGVAQPFGFALREIHALGPPPEYLYVALAFLAELQLLEVLDERAGHKPRSEPAVGDEELFAAVLPALVDHEGPLRSLLDLAAPDLDRVLDRARLRRQQAGDDAVEFALSVLDRAQPLSLSSAAQ
ncbi:MAG: hypothetical protein AAGE52_24335 [Myxococcota bacterium]